MCHISINKIEHRRPRYIEIIKNIIMKIKIINIDFVMGLPKTNKRYERILAMDRLTKASYFLLIQINYAIDQYIQLYI